nr:bifunctional phosphopantothenoylcysteine decarboxylase/phosphopantothenate--cysteine ligase CoaBC [Phaeovibrio sulfidiphilus]
MRVLLIISGGVAAYKSLDLIRRLQERGFTVTCVLTEAAQQFVTPLSVAALCGGRVHTDLFAPEAALSHITLSREADVVVVAPATANTLARMAAGLADDLATAVLLASDKPVLVAPAMNPAMWAASATRENVERLEARGVHRVGPECGDMACGETGAGRMADVSRIVDAVGDLLAASASGGSRPLAGRTVLVTAGPTHEPIDPVRFIANRSSGRQGQAIAVALARLGADVTLVHGPGSPASLPSVRVVPVTTALSMLEACEAALPVDVAVCAAAVADWRIELPAGQKIKKPEDGGAAGLSLSLVPNPDILARLSRPGPGRPDLVVGFAAETRDVIENAVRKRARKGCDWILANDVSDQGNRGQGSPFGHALNTIHFITPSGHEDWPTMSKEEVAGMLANRIVDALETSSTLRRSLP